MSINIKISDKVSINLGTSDEDIAKAVLAYRALDGNKLKAAARKSANDAMMKAVMGSDMATAQWARNIGEMLVSAKPSAHEDIDPADVLIEMVAELELAAFMLRGGLATPVGLELPEGFDRSAVEYITMDDEAATGGIAKALGESRAMSIVGAAGAFAEAKRTRSGDRIDIGAAILGAFAGLESGEFLTVSEIAKKANAGTGPVAARLFPTYRATDKKTGVKVVEPRECTVDGIRPGIGGKNDAKGAYLI